MFITFEGPDGCGKTTIANMVIEKLEKEGYNVLYSREPGGVRIAEAIRNIILNKEFKEIDDRTEALLFAASRRQHIVEKILPALENRQIVICDRFLDSSLAYQGGGKGLGVENILNINLFATENIFPDFTFLFDLSPEEGLKRISKNHDREINRLDLESVNFYKTVCQTYRELAKEYKERYIIIDASKSIEEVFDETYSKIKKILDENK